MGFFKKKNILLKKHLVCGKLSLSFMITSSEIYKKKKPMELA
jgi:hypothetical protein